MHSKALWIKASTKYILLCTEKHDGSAVAGLARNNSLGRVAERERAARDGLKEEEGVMDGTKRTVCGEK